MIAANYTGYCHEVVDGDADDDDDYHNYRYYGANYSCTQTVVPKYLYRDYSKATVYTLSAHRALFSLAQNPWKQKLKLSELTTLEEPQKLKS